MGVRDAIGASFAHGHRVQGMGVADRSRHPLQPDQELAALGQQFQRGRCEREPARRAKQQLDVQFILKIPDGTLQQSLIEVDAFGSTPKVQVFSHWHEAAQVLQSDHSRLACFAGLMV